MEEKTCAYCKKPIRPDQPYATVPVPGPPYAVYLHLVYTTLNSPPCYGLWLVGKNPETPH